MLSQHVLNRPHLLDYALRAQYSDVLHPATRSEYAREDRAEAIFYVKRLAELRRETPADTLRHIVGAE